MKKHLTVDQSLTNATQTLHREAIGLVSKMGASFKRWGGPLRPSGGKETHWFSLEEVPPPNVIFGF